METFCSLVTVVLEFRYSSVKRGHMGLVLSPQNEIFFPRMAWVNPWHMVYTHLSMVPQYSVVVIIAKVLNTQLSIRWSHI